MTNSRFAGADLALSYASMGVNTVFNLLRGGDYLLLAEGLSLFPAAIPASIAGRSLGESKIRTRTGCTVISVDHGGLREMNPGLDFVMPKGGRMYLVGTLEAEDKFLEVFLPAPGILPGAPRSRNAAGQDARQRRAGRPPSDLEK